MTGSGRCSPISSPTGVAIEFRTKTLEGLKAVGRPKTAVQPVVIIRMHGGLSPGAPKGNKNAFKHGRYSAEAIARRRVISGLIRAARDLAR